MASLENICDNCETKLSEYICTTCELNYCSECCLTFHSKGNLKSHIYSKSTSNIPVNCEHGISCYNIPGIYCEDCSVHYCTECSKKVHRKGALAKHTLKVLAATKEKSIQGSSAWEDTSLGWFPNPKGRKCAFFNSLLPDIYNATWDFIPDKRAFKKYFIGEANRQWKFQTEAEELEDHLNFVKSDNPSSIGRFLKGAILKPGDRAIFMHNTVNIERHISNAQILIKQLNYHDNELYDQSGRQLTKSYFNICHAFNRRISSKTEDVLQQFKDLQEKCKQLQEKVTSLFSNKRKYGRTEEGSTRKKARHSKRKAEKRKIKRYFNRGLGVMKKLCPTVSYCRNKLPSLKDVKEVNYGFKDLDILCLNFDGVKSLTYGEMKFLVPVLESNVFDNVAKCFILDNLVSKLVEDKYWVEYDKFYEVENIESSENSDSEKSDSCEEQEGDISDDQL